MGIYHPILAAQSSILGVATMASHAGQRLHRPTGLGTAVVQPIRAPKTGLSSRRTHEDAQGTRRKDGLTVRDISNEESGTGGDVSVG